MRGRERCELWAAGALKRVKTFGHRNPCARRASIRLPRKEVQFDDEAGMERRSVTLAHHAHARGSKPLSTIAATATHNRAEKGWRRVTKV